MLRKRLAVLGASAALVLGTATIAMAAGGGNGPGTNPDCPGDCTGQQVQLQERENVANAGDELQLRERVQTQLQDGTGDQKQLRTQAGEPVRERNQELIQGGDCDGTCDQVQTQKREMAQDGDCDGSGDQVQNQVQAREHMPDGTPNTRGQNGRNGGGNGGK